MQLSAELFEKTIRGIKGDMAVGAKDLRKQARVGLRCRIQIIPVETGVVGKAIDVWTRDISPAGIGILTSLRIAVGKRFAIRLPRQTGEAPLSILCTVKNCTELATGIFAVGAFFESLAKHPAHPAVA